MKPSIQSRMSYEDYSKLPGVSITRLKELDRSPLHYQHRLAHAREGAALALGIVTHCAVLEPERFDSEYAVWTERTEAGASSPRRGKKWEAFVAANADKKFCTDDERAAAFRIRDAVRANPIAMSYLATGEPEVSMTWRTGEHASKGRIDWLTHIDGGAVIVGLKTARDCRPFIFGSAAAKLGYHMQWAHYADGYFAIRNRYARLVEIVVESEPPHAVAVYRIPTEVTDQGREEYMRLYALLGECQQANEWPGPVEGEPFLSLPSWAYGPADDDQIASLGLEL